MSINTSTIVLMFLFTCFGIIIGSVVQHALDRRSSHSTGSPSSQDSSITKPPQVKEDVEILRAYRTPAGKTWLEMQGMHLNEQDGLNLDQRHDLIKFLVDLRPWLEPVKTGQDVQRTRPVSSELNPPDSLPGKLEQDIKPVPELKSIVQQIDDILQARLIERSIIGRDIRLMEGTGGTVIVKDGLKSYEGVDAVPDPEIRSLIREAVAEWEKRSL